MEDDHEAEIIGIGKDVFVKLHHVLLVASEEVDLDAFDAYALHPAHLIASHAAVVHLVDRRLGGVVPCSVGVVPKEESHSLFLAIACKFGYLVISYLHVPECVYEHCLVSHCGGEVDISLLLVVVAAWVHADDPAPRALAVGVFLRSLVLWSDKVEWHCCLHYIGESGAEGDGAPWCLAWERHGGCCRAPAVALAWLRETDAVATALRVEQTACHILAVNSCLADECPALVAYAEEAREGVAFSPSVLAHGIIERVGCLVAW